MLFAPAPPVPIVDVRPVLEIRTASPLNEVAVDDGDAATLVGETPSWQYVLIWSTKGVVIRPNLLCDLQESDIVLAGERFAHVCTEAGANTVLTGTFRHSRGVARLNTQAFVTLAGQGSLVAGSAGRTLWRFDPTRKVKLHVYRSSVLVYNVDRNRILVGRTNTVLELVSRTGKTMATLKIPHVGGAVLRGAHIGSIASHRFILSNLRGKRVRTRPVVGDPSLVDFDGSLVAYSRGTRLHLLRVSDGRDVALRFKGQFGYASVKFWHGGLFYVYNVRGGPKPGHAGYVGPAGVKALFK
jgi:hypothetical protein